MTLLGWILLLWIALSLSGIFRFFHISFAHWGPTINNECSFILVEFQWAQPSEKSARKEGVPTALNSLQLHQLKQTGISCLE